MSVECTCFTVGWGGGGGGQNLKIYKIANFVYSLLFMPFTTLLLIKNLLLARIQKNGGYMLKI